jgi:glycosyltransferase involved in cell wall biosynthesis
MPCGEELVMSCAGDLAVVLWRGGLGGAETHTARLAKELRAQGLDARVVFVTEAARLATVLEDYGVPFTELGLTRGLHVLRHPRRLASAVAHAGAAGAILPSPGYVVTALRVGGYRGRVMAVEHGALLQLERRGVGVRLARRLEREIGTRGLDALICVSALVRDRYATWLRPGEVHVVANGIDLDDFSPRADVHEGVVIASAGRLIPEKGFDVLLEAFAGLPQKRGVALVVAGTGPDRRRLESLAGELGIAEEVRFLGLVADMPSFWRTADIAVVPSSQSTESFGMVAVEAMACGCPVVASDSGALPQVVGPLAGTVVPRGDAEALTRALESLVVDSHKRCVMGQAARERCVRRYDIRATASAYRACARGDGHLG